MKLFFLCTLFSLSLAENILIKFPTRERPTQFLKQLNLYTQLLSGKNNVCFVISIDEDDATMNNLEVLEQIKSSDNIKVCIGPRTTKIGAINRDVQSQDFDILLLASDDMTPVQQDYDQIIVEAFKKYFPDLDGTLHFNDGHVGQVLNTFPIMGKKYYDRFGYIYHPEYISIECDREYTTISQLMNKVVYIDQVLFRHDHPLYGNNKDQLFYVNEAPAKHRHDQRVYQLHLRNKFGIDKQTDYINSTIDSFVPKKKASLQIELSILIPTLDSRQDQFKTLYAKLKKQLEKHKLQTKVEVVYFKDNKHHSVGYKRNKLIEKAVGKYICFLDDDDDVHTDYIKILFDALSSQPDCVGISGIITDKGQNPTPFIQSLQNKGHSKKDGKYLWPIRHLNPIKRDIAAKFIFPDKNNGEDTSWHMSILRSGLLKTEAFVEIPIYFYNYDLDKSETRN